MTIDGVTYTSGVDAALTLNPDGSWSLDLSGVQTLADDIYDVVLVSTDTAGNTSSDTTSDEIIIDTNIPGITVTSQITSDNQPTITGTVTDTLAEVTALSVVANGTTYTLADPELSYVAFPSGVWELDLSAITPLADGSYEIVASVTDGAGNTSNDTSTNELVIDTAVPLVTINEL